MIAGLGITASSCRVDFTPESPDGNVRQMATPNPKELPVKATRLAESPKDRECRLDEQSGCLVGQVIVAPTIYAEGREYFDAESLGRDLPRLVAVQMRKDESAPKGREDELRLEPAITNDSFVRNFTVYLKGERAATTRVSERGSFRFNNLNEGTYDLRAQRSFVVRLPRHEHPTGEEALAPGNEILVCATIYAEALGLEVRAGEKLYQGFDSFNLKLSNGDCSRPQLFSVQGSAN
jgi:hypothetical protein